MDWRRQQLDVDKESHKKEILVVGSSRQKLR